MPIDSKEDQSCPINQSNISKILPGSRNDKQSIVDIITQLLGEKRDAYHGILQSIILIVNTHDADLTQILKDSLIKLIVSNPMYYGGEMFLNKVLYRLTLEVPSFVVELFEQIIKETDDWKTAFHQDKDILSIQVLSLKAIRRAEGVDCCKSCLLPEEEIDKICDAALSKCHDATKIDTLCFILESKKSTLPLEERQLELFKIIFSDAIRLQDPALRQILLSQTNKLLNRIFASYKVVVRCIKLYTEDYKESLQLKYRNFLKYLIQFCLNNIYCHAYFGSFTLTITTLKTITGLCKTHGDDFKLVELLRSKRCYDTMLCCINDSFEHNKTMALDLILSLPYNEEFISEKNLSNLENLAYSLIDSVNPSHSLTCQYLFKLIVGLRCKQVGSRESKNQHTRKHLIKLVTIVEESVGETKNDFLYGLKIKPIYPKLICIRALLNDIDISDIESDREEWELISKKLVTISIDACKAMSAIVCNLNPETIGHLPMDLKPMDISELTETLSISSNVSMNGISTITSQMLLISGWKTVKECSLSMGSLCNLFWWPSEPIRKKREKNPGFKSPSILESSDVIKIIDFFDHYLRNLRHRGAFEQAYNGFILVTKRIWHDQQFRDRLIRILEVMMSDFKNESQDDRKVEYLKAYITRRSAGLPLLVKAILSSEFRQDSKTLNWVLDSSFEILDDNNSKDYQKIHCLNIMKALIKEHDLGEKVLPNVGRTIRLAMKCFKSDSFPIRNCASMLLKATVDRTFGVNRLRGVIHRRNQLSFEKFFQMSPELFSDMLNHLNEGLNNPKCLATVHSVYIILFRLTSTLDLDYEKFVGPFIQPVLDLAFKCSDYKLRKLSAKLVVRLECFRESNNLYERKSYYTDLFKSTINAPYSKDINKLHGTILILKNWIEHSDYFMDQSQELVKNTIKSKKLETHSVILYELMDLAETCCIKNYPKDNRWFWELYISTFHEMFSMTQTELQQPYYEGFLFKFITTALLNCPLHIPNEPKSTYYPDRSLTSEKDDVLSHLTDSIKLLRSIIIADSDQYRYPSSDLQAACIRFIRQLLYGTDRDYFDTVYDQLDMDLLTTHLTPYDKFFKDFRSEQEKAKLMRYCQNEGLRKYIEGCELFYKIGLIPFNMCNYDEYEDCGVKTHKEFESVSVRTSNTPRAVELLALGCKFLGSQLHSDPSRHSSDFSSIFHFVNEIEDCDVLCVGIMYTGRLIREMTKTIVLDDKNIESLCRSMVNLSQGDHSVTLRASCSEFIDSTINTMIGMKSPSKRLLYGSLTHLLFALSNLCQDEDPQIRNHSQDILIKIRDCFPNRSFNPEANRLKELIKLIASEIYDPNNDDHIKHCVNLLLRFIFNKNSDRGYVVEEIERESLFDKSRINDFADNVELVEASMEALDIFIGRRHNKDMPHLSIQSIPQEILPELATIGRFNAADDDWRIGSFCPNRKRSKQPSIDGDHIDGLMERLIENIHYSLSYYDSDYKNMMIDTEYTYNEIALFKNLSFIKFISKFQQAQLQKHPIIRCHQRLFEICF